MRVQSARHRTADQRVDDGSPASTLIAPSEDPVLASQGDLPQGPFRRVVVEIESAVLQESL